MMFPQLTVAILNSETGQNAQFYVEKELKPEQERAPILPRLMVVLNVWAKRQRHEPVLTMTVQVYS